MILDAIIGLFVAIFESLTIGISAVFVPLFNLVAAGIELVVGLFVSGFKVRRMECKKGAPQNRTVSIVTGAMGLVGLIAIVWFLVGPMVTQRKITMMAEDGHSLPFVAVIVHTKDGDQSVRSDNAGNLTISRFNTTALTVKDPRYVAKTWKSGEIESKLIVRRTVLGSALDRVAEKLLRPAKE